MHEGNLSCWILQSKPLHSCPQFKAPNFCRVVGKISIGANIHVSNSRPWQFSREQKLHRELAYKMSLLGSFQRPEELKLSGVIWCTRYPCIKTSWEQTQNFLGEGLVSHVPKQKNKHRLWGLPSIFQCSLLPMFPTVGDTSSDMTLPHNFIYTMFGWLMLHGPADPLQWRK